MSATELIPERRMSLEGQLRDLGLAEVLQLLGLSKKTGILQLHAPLHGRAARVRMLSGAIVDAVEHATNDDGATPENPEGRNLKAVATCVAALMLWPDGEFRFIADSNAQSTGVRISVESVLMEAANSGEVWNRIRDRVPHQRVIPAFVDVESQRLPFQRLAPQEWEILTRVDGIRDLQALATVLGRDLVDVAEIVHRLMESGLLTLRELPVVEARHPTPPTGSTVGCMAAKHGDLRDNAVIAPPTETDLWIPDRDGRMSSAQYDSIGDDSIFDPIEVGVQMLDGRPKRRTAPRSIRAHAETPFFPVLPAVAEPAVETSVPRGDASETSGSSDAAILCQHGDEAARKGDLAGALMFWGNALRSDVRSVDADRIREAMTLAARLHALLHPAEQRA